MFVGIGVFVGVGVIQIQSVELVQRGLRHLFVVLLHIVPVLHW